MWAAAGKGPLQVFILAGQPNMEGHGVIKGGAGQNGSLETRDFFRDGSVSPRPMPIIGAAMPKATTCC